MDPSRDDFQKCSLSCALLGSTVVGFELVLDTAVPQLGRELDEQIVDTSVRAGLKRLRDLQGFSTRQSSTAQSRDDLQGFLPGQGSAGPSREALQSHLPGQGSTQPRLEMLSMVPSHDRVQQPRLQMLPKVLPGLSSTAVDCGGLQGCPRTESNSS